MFKKLKTLLLSGVILLSIIPLSTANAATMKSYPSPVEVEVFEGSSFSILLDGFYQLVNKANGQKYYLQPNIAIQVSNSGSTVNVSSSQLHVSSSSGFDIREYVGGTELVRFSTDTPMRRGATSSYPVTATLKSGESAEYLGSFTNSAGELWFNVENGNGESGWVSRATTFPPITAPATSLFTVNSKKYRGGFQLKDNGSHVEVINRLDIEDYLKGVVPNEMPASWPKEALKAQAISARSYAKNSGVLQSSTASQVYRGYNSEDSRTNAAVEETRGLLVKYNGKPIQTFFFSTSGGRTANVGDVWNSNQSYYPYLVSVDDPYEVSPYSSWSVNYSARDILTNFGFSSSAVLYDIDLYQPGENGEVRGVTLNTSAGSKTFNGNELEIRRWMKRENGSALYSNWFDLELNKIYSVKTTSKQTSQFNVSGQSVMLANGTTTTINTTNVNIQTNSGVITKATNPKSITANGKGWGHRIGMSQYGAKGFAEHGWTAEQILTHYFQGTTISK